MAEGLGDGARKGQLGQPGTAAARRFLWLRAEASHQPTQPGWFIPSSTVSTEHIDMGVPQQEGPWNSHSHRELRLGDCFKPRGNLAQRQWPSAVSTTADSGSGCSPGTNKKLSFCLRRQTGKELTQLSMEGGLCSGVVWSFLQRRVTPG